MNAFKAIDTKLSTTKTTTAAKSGAKDARLLKRGLTATQRLEDGGEHWTDKTKGAKFWNYGPSKTLKVLFAGLKIGLSPLAFRVCSPALASRFPWADVTDDIKAAATEAGVDPNEVVAALEPVVTIDPVPAPKKSRTRTRKGKAKGSPRKAAPKDTGKTVPLGQVDVSNPAPGVVAVS